ncbi:MAG: peptide chain release factor N(5)-glutamine methyltransferase [Rhodospirillaceae bacterium]|jgi:release factor glutamine methyltransferase|nr:peptide chain release factor N(5)-glutamine methyltransferase [Rhodospirillaceae bacterium]
MTLGKVLNDLTGLLLSAGIPSARLDARILISHVLGISTTTVFSHQERFVSIDEIKRIWQVSARRINHEPISHIICCREFWSLSFKVTKDTFDPNPDTETVVEAALSAIFDRQASIRLLDFGTGTGCILLALLSELPQAFGLGIDISQATLCVARENAKSLGLQHRSEFMIGNWGKEIDMSFDVILSNPPYIPKSDIDNLENEVSIYTPKIALDGGNDGLVCYRSLIPDIARLLVPNGIVALEIGRGQSNEVSKLFQKYGLTFTTLHYDLAGIDRCILVKDQNT